MAKRTARDIKNELEKTIDPLEALNILRKHIRAIAIENSTARKKLFKNVKSFYQDTLLNNYG